MGIIFILYGDPEEQTQNLQRIRKFKMHTKPEVRNMFLLVFMGRLLQWTGIHVFLMELVSKHVQFRYINGIGPNKMFLL